MKLVKDKNSTFDEKEINKIYKANKKLHEVYFESQYDNRDTKTLRTIIENLDKLLAWQYKYEEE